MKDQADLQTTDIFESAKRCRGRPVTVQALSNAERQRRYRQNLQIKTVTVTEKQGQGGDTFEHGLYKQIAQRNMDELERLRAENEKLGCLLSLSVRTSESYRKQIANLNEDHIKLLVKHDRLLNK
jgi:hypothetical protein